MNWAFLYPPIEPERNAYALAGECKYVAIAAADAAKDEVRRAHARLSDAFDKHIEDTYEGGTIIARAEEHLASCEARLIHAVNKRRWELDDKWKVIFPRTAAAIARTRALMLRIDWPKLRPKL